MPAFPHAGHPVAPPLLRPVLSVGLPVSLARLSVNFPLLADLDERIWAYVDRSVAGHLGQLVISRAGQMRSAPFWRKTYFPRLKAGLNPEEIQIEDFTYQCLGRMFKDNVLDCLPSLTKYTLDYLVSEIPGFGIKQLIDLLAGVHFQIVDATAATDPSDRLTIVDLRNIAKSPSSWPSYSDKRFPLLTTTASLEELQLSVRAHNTIEALLEGSVILDLADLSRLTVRQLMERPNFGRRSLVLLLKSIEPFVLEPLSPQPSSLRAATPSANPTLSGNIKQFYGMNRHFPEIPSTTTLADLQLDTRTFNCLTELMRAEIISKPSDISRLTFEQMMHTKNFGRKSLASLLSSLERLSDSTRTTEVDSGLSSPRPLATNVTEAAERLAFSRVASRVRCNDPRMWGLCRDLLRFANNCCMAPPLNSDATLQLVAKRLAARTVDPEAPGRLVDLLYQVRLRLAELMRMELDVELRSLLSIYLADRNLEMVLAFWGWTGGCPRTLQSVGDSYGLTRERVRQIAGKAERFIYHRKIFLPALERSIRFICRRTPANAVEVESELQEAGLTACKFRVEAIGACAEQFSQLAPFSVDEAEGVRVVLQAKDAGLVRLITLHARRSASRYGVANIVDLQEELADECHFTIDLKLLRSVIGGIPSYEDLGKGWFWIQSLSRNHLSTIIRKVLAVAPRIHVSEMRAAIANDPRGMGFAPPKDVVLCFCQSALNCVVEDDFIVVRLPEDPAKALSSVEHVFFEVFRTHGPLLARADVEQLCGERGVNPITLSLYLSRLAIVAKYGVGIYGLRGATFSPDDLSRMAPRRQKRYSEHGWTATADLWAAVELSASALGSGVVQLPSAVWKQASGTYIVRTEDGVVLGRLVVSPRSTWGLGRLFRRRGGEPGDILLLTFNLAQREVTARLGDLTILPEPENFAQEVLN